MMNFKYFNQQQIEVVMKCLFIVFALITIMAAFPAHSAWSQDNAKSSNGCPDEIKCKQWYTDDMGKSHQITIGTIDVPCCYSFPTGCRPWHCDGVKDRGWLGNKEYWAKKCNERFPDCTKIHGGYTQDTCWPHYVTY